MLSGCLVLGRIWAAPLRWVISRSDCRKACYSAGYDVTKLSYPKSISPGFIYSNWFHSLYDPTLFSNRLFSPLQPLPKLRVEPTMAGSTIATLWSSSIERCGGALPALLQYTFRQNNHTKLVRVYVRSPLPLSHLSSLNPRHHQKYFSPRLLSPPRYACLPGLARAGHFKDNDRSSEPSP
jgi:hypothetical protein